MAFCIVMGQKTFTSLMEEYRGKMYQCRGCGNPEAYCQKDWTWFTVCWIPVIPFSLGWHKYLFCPRCGKDNLSDRPDITSGQATQGYPLQQGPQGQPYQQGPQGPPFQQGPQGQLSPQGQSFQQGPQGSPFQQGPQGQPSPQGPMGGGYGGPPAQQAQYK